MAEIPDQVAAEVLSKCARRCCICRRFKPIHLQVHHIIERAAGGTNDIDNLIALCLQCHTDVHSRVPFARRFTAIELKLHRDAVYKHVAEGTFSNIDEDVTVRLSTTSSLKVDESPKLIPEAINLLIKLSQGDGFLYDFTSSHGFGSCFDREDATRQAAFNQLRDRGFIQFQSGELYAITLEGFNAADEYIAILNSDSSNAGA